MSALISRSAGGPMTAWWFTVDRLLLAGLVVLIGVGVTLSLAAGTMVAEKKELPTYFFVQRHLAFALLSLVLMVGVSL
ncbi:MAG: cell division protein FtsW, partial [Pseudomonadota bacterium]